MRSYEFEVAVFFEAEDDEAAMGVVSAIMVVPGLDGYGALPVALYERGEDEDDGGDWPRTVCDF